MLRLAICGTFDIENYGDLLFPKVFSAAMAARGFEFELMCFAPHGSAGSTNEIVGKSWPLDKLEAMHNVKPFDAIIVGGGALVHLREVRQKLPSPFDFNKTYDYPIFKTWVLPAIFASQNGVPLYWNSPDAPYEFPKELQKLCCGLIKVSDYISVRNISSRDNLISTGVDEDLISICPDTALCLSRYFKDELQTGELSHFGGDYFVVHVNGYLSEDEAAKIAETVNLHAEETGERVVLLCLAPTHRDEDGLKLVLSKITASATVINPRTIGGMASVIASANAYMGVSFHGAITAISYGIPAVAFNYMRYRKTADLYADLGLMQLYCETAEELGARLSELRRGNFHTDKPGSLNYAQEAIERHFDLIAGRLKNLHQNKGRDVISNGLSTQVIYDLIEIQIKALEKESATRVQLQNMDLAIEHVLKKNQWLHEQLDNWYGPKITSLASDVASLAPSMDHVLQKISWLESQVVSQSHIQAQMEQRLAVLEGIRDRNHNHIDAGSGEGAG